MTEDERLTLYFYADGLEQAERDAIRERLADDDAFAQRYATLRAELAMLRLPVVKPTPALSATLHETLIDAASVTTPPPRSRAVAWAVAASVVLGIALVGLSLRSIDRAPQSVETTTSIGTPGPSAATVEAARTVRLVQSHLVQSQLQLVRYQEAGPTRRGDLIDDLIAQNRAIETAAERGGDEDLARVLRAFEAVLERLASGATDDAHSEQLLEQLNFELSAMLTKLDAPASDPALSF